MLEVAVATQGLWGMRRCGARASKPARIKCDILNCEKLEDRRLLSSIVWSPGIDLPAARGDAMALSDAGLILVFGGTSTTGSSNSVYEFDAYNGEWIAAPSLDTARTAGGVGQTGHAGPINTGGEGGYKYSSDIFLFGGKQTQSTSSVENYGWYNSEGNITGPSMSASRSAFAYATDPASGDLYAIGGLTGSSTVLAGAEHYDPVTDKWSAIAPLPQALYSTSAATDGFGHIFVFGGAHTTTGAASAAVYRYTIATNTWETMASMPLALRDASAVDAPDGRIYLVGGKSAAGAVANVESYNPAENSWSDETALPGPVYGAALGIDFDNNIEVIGGFDSAGSPVNTVLTAPITPGLVTPYTPSIVLDNTSLTYDGLPQGVTATALGIDGMTPVDGAFTITYNGSSAEPVNVGAYSVLVSFVSDDPNYLNTVLAGELDITQATPTLNVSGGGTINYDGQPHPISATALGVDNATSVNGTFSYTYNGSTTAPVNPGVYNALATFTSSDANYTDASASATITIPDPTIPTGLTAAGASTTSIYLSWNPVTIAPCTYRIHERHVIHDPKGSGSTITYPVVASGITDNSVTLDVPTAFAGSAGHTYYVTSVDNVTGIESAKSAPASAKPLYAPSLYGAMTISGAVVSFLYAPVSQATKITLLSYANEPATYSIQNGPATMSVDPQSGLVSYVPSMSEAGTMVMPTFAATNSVGSSTYGGFAFIVVLPADANYDGQVDTSDFNALALHFNQSSAGFSGGDFNSDGVVNALDFNVLATNFGATIPAHTTAAAASAAPSALPSLFADQAIHRPADDLLN